MAQHFKFIDIEIIDIWCVIIILIGSFVLVQLINELIEDYF